VVFVLCVLVGPAFLVGSSLSSSASGAAQRSEAEDYKDVPSQLYFMHGSNPSAPGNCVARVFATFKELKGWVPLFAGAGNAGVTIYEPPYEDTYSPYPGVVWQAPAGYHWVGITQSSVSGSAPNDCSSLSAQQQQSLGPTGVVTHKITDQCDFARTGVRDAQNAVQKAKKKVKNTIGQAHDKAVAKLKKAKADLKKAKKEFKKNCTP
jgi:hypothetical protein